MIWEPAADDREEFDSDVCECGHVRDEHENDGRGPCTAWVRRSVFKADSAYQCRCVHFERAQDYNDEGGE